MNNFHFSFHIPSTLSINKRAAPKSGSFIMYFISFKVNWSGVA
jgi:hypothetical protein